MATTQQNSHEPVEMAFVDNDDVTLATRHQPSFQTDTKTGYVATQPEPLSSNIQYQHNPNFVCPIDKLGNESDFIDCPYCHKRTETRVTQSHSPMTYVVGVLLGFFCVCIACLPCINHWFPDVDHFCTNCQKQVSHRPHNGQTQVLKASTGTQVISEHIT